MDKNRYREIVFCDKALEIEGCPVVLLEYQILLDRKKHTTVVEMIWQNLDQEKVKYVDIEIERLDRNFNYIGEAPVAYTYNRVNAKSQAVFGEKQYIDLLTMDTRSVDIKVISVEMADGYIWEEKGQDLPEEESGEAAYAETEEYSDEDFFEEESETEAYEEFEDEEIEFEDFFEEAYPEEEAFEDEDLEFISLTEEEAYQEKENKKAGKKRFRVKEHWEAEEEDSYGDFFEEDGYEEYEEEEEFDIEADMEERRGRIIMIAASSIGGVLIVVLALCIIFQNDIKARRYEKNGEYEEMMAILDDTILMKNNNSMLKSAKKYIANKEYDKALELLSECGDGEEITKLLEETRYLQACSYMEEEKYANAATMFYHLGNYEDSEQRYEECRKKAVSDSNDNETEGSKTNQDSKEGLGMDEILNELEESEAAEQTIGNVEKSKSAVEKYKILPEGE